MEFRDFCTGFTLSGFGKITVVERAPNDTVGLLARLNRPGPGAVLVSAIAMGLSHRWFPLQGRPMRTGNCITLLMDGEEVWAHVRSDLERAQSQSLMASWWWQSNFELTRPMPAHIDCTPQQRWANTVVSVLETSPAVKRILVGEFWGSHDILDWITRDKVILGYAETPGDNFEFMGQGNPTSERFHFEVAPFDFRERFAARFPMEAALFPDAQWIASDVPGKDVDFSGWPVGVAFQAAFWHQKFSVMDQRVAFVGGMNVKSTDWDTSQYLVYEPRRMEERQWPPFLRKLILAKNLLKETTDNEAHGIERVKIQVECKSRPACGTALQAGSGGGMGVSAWGESGHRDARISAGFLCCAAGSLARRRDSSGVVPESALGIVGEPGVVHEEAVRHFLPGL